MHLEGNWRPKPADRTGYRTSKLIRAADGGPADAGPECPGVACMAPVRACIGLVNNAGKADFTLRASQLTVTLPGSTVLA